MWHPLEAAVASNYVRRFFNAPPFRRITWFLPLEYELPGKTHFWQIGCDGSDDVWLLRLRLERPWLFPSSRLDHSPWRSHVWGHSSNSIERPMGPGTEASCQQSCGWVPSSLQMTSALTAISQETLSQNHLAKPFPNSDPQKVWDNNGLLCKLLIGG